MANRYSWVGLDPQQEESIANTRAQEEARAVIGRQMVTAQAATDAALAELLAERTAETDYLQVGTGSPEGSVTAGVGAIYTQTDGANGKVLWVKRTGTGNTGWAKISTDLGIFSAEDYGVVADGTDKLAEINAALAACHAAGGGVVLLPAGNIGVSGAIVMPGGTAKAVALVGADMHSTYLKPLVNNMTVIDHSGSSSVERLTIDGTGRTGIIGIDMNSNARLRDIRVKNCDVAGLDYVGNSGTSVGVFYSIADTLYIDTCGYGIRMQTTGGGGWVNSNQVFNAQIRGCTTAGILLNGAYGNTFYAVDIETNAQGVRLLDGQGNRIYGNWFEKNPLPSGGYALHIAYTYLTAGTVIHANGLAGFAARVQTTGGITSGTATLEVASATNIENGKVLAVAGAGAAGATLYSEVIAVSGTTITLANNASTTVAGAVVTGPEFVGNASVEIVGEQYAYRFGTSFVDEFVLAGKGGAGQVLKQSALNGNVTVETLAASELSNGVTGTGAVVLATAPTVTNPTADKLTLNQGAADDKIVDLKSSDVAHGMTDIAEADTYGYAAKARAADGGLLVRGLKDTAGGFALVLSGYANGAADTTKTTAAEGLVNLNGGIASGSFAQAAGADGNLVTIENYNLTRFIFDAEGDGHADVAWVAF